MYWTKKYGTETNIRVKQTNIEYKNIIITNDCATEEGYEVITDKTKQLRVKPEVAIIHNALLERLYKSNFEPLEIVMKNGDHLRINKPDLLGMADAICNFWPEFKKFVYECIYCRPH